MSDGSNLSGPPDSPDESSSPGTGPRTGIIRRAPTGAIPVVADDPPTSLVAREDDEGTAYIPRARPTEIPRTAPKPARPHMAAAAAVLSILGGWATSVIATDLIAGWWRTDRLFCVAIGFLTAISAAASIGGLILLLLRRRMGRLLIVVGSLIGLMIFTGLFVAGARLAPVVYAIPVLPVACITVTFLPATRRWARVGS